jgi:hypothetical protein
MIAAIIKMDMVVTTLSGDIVVDVSFCLYCVREHQSTDLLHTLNTILYKSVEIKFRIDRAIKIIF